MATPRNPQHLGIIMDGNRRWATARGLTAIEGHRAGYQALKALLPAMKRADIPYLSVYAFSSENWSRSKTEIRSLMQLLKWALTAELNIFMEEGIQIRVIGSTDNLTRDVLEVLRKAEVATANNTKGTLGICFNYGGQQEIVDALKQILEQGNSPADITPELIAQHLYAPDMPPIDLIIRTSGEQRLSNFMLWRAAYSELLFIDKHWPDFSEQDLDDALAEYARRQRRFGK